MIDGPNLYAYVTNDPINYIDPMGTTISIGNDPGIWEDDTMIPDPVADIFDTPSGSPKMDEVAMSDPGPINSGQSAGDCPKQPWYNLNKTSGKDEWKFKEWEVEKETSWKSINRRLYVVCENDKGEIIRKQIVYEQWWPVTEL